MDNQTVDLITDLYVRSDFTAQELKSRVDNQTFLKIGFFLVNKAEKTMNDMFEVAQSYQQYQEIVGKVIDNR